MAEQESTETPEQAAQRIVADLRLSTSMDYRVGLTEAITTAITSAVAAQKEHDAKIADAEFAKLYHGVDYGDVDDCAAYRIAAAIRKGD